MIGGNEFTSQRNGDLSRVLWPLVGKHMRFGQGQALVTRVTIDDGTDDGPATLIDFVICPDAYQPLLAELDKTHPSRDSDHRVRLARLGALTRLVDACLDKAIEQLEEAAKPTPEQVAANAIIDSLTRDLAANFLYYDRKEDDELSPERLYAMIDAGETTLERIVATFRAHLLAEFDRNRP